jgi:hypothetical protein
MDRRRALALLGLGLSFSAGCATSGATGPRTPPTPGEASPAAGGNGGGNERLRISDQDFEEVDDGSLRILATVRNPTGTERTRTLVVAVTIEGSTTERRREVTVPGDDRRAVAVDFEDIAFDDFASGGSLRSRLE